MPELASLGLATHPKVGTLALTDNVVREQRLDQPNNNQQKCQSMSSDLVSHFAKPCFNRRDAYLSIVSPKGTKSAHGCFLATYHQLVMTVINAFATLG
jgi:hypothetical protein